MYHAVSKTLHSYWNCMKIYLTVFKYLLSLVPCQIPDHFITYLYTTQNVIDHHLDIPYLLSIVRQKFKFAGPATSSL